MFTLLLALIYISFISLGLPDSLLGSAWPVMRVEFNASLDFAGAISMIITAGTIVSSLLSDRMTRKFGAGVVTAVSVSMTAIALFGFSVSGSVPALCLWAIPYGLGAGGVDAALNNFVALHYSARHMSWLHCFWGLGASISPYIMSTALAHNLGWRVGYSTVSIIQVVLALVLFATLPIWKKVRFQTSDASTEVTTQPVGLLAALKIRGVPYVLLAFFAYCSLEGIAILWTSSYLVEHRGVDTEVAAAFASLFYLGITAGRFLNGFIADKFGDRNMIRAGIGVLSVGIVLIMLPVSSNIPAFVGLLITGLGCAPIYPSIIHATPSNFGRENSQAIVGIQMACAYTGNTIMPPVFGMCAKHISMALFPFFMAAFAIMMLIMTESLNRICSKK